MNHTMLGIRKLLLDSIVYPLGNLVRLIKSHISVNCNLNVNIHFSAKKSCLKLICTKNTVVNDYKLAYLGYGVIIARFIGHFSYGVSENVNRYF